MHAQEIILHLEKKIQALPPRDLGFPSRLEMETHAQEQERLIEQEIINLSPPLQQRVREEFAGFGPLSELMQDEDVTEILVNGPDAIWFEKKGQLRPWTDRFASLNRYQQIMRRLGHAAQAHYTLDRPMADGRLSDFRVHLVGEEITRTYPVLSLRRHPRNPWNFQRLLETGWATGAQIQQLRLMLEIRESFLVIGSTGSGKTSVLNSFLQELDVDERAIIIEDTPELTIPNPASTRLLTRRDAQGVLVTIEQMELVRQSLRMRPDRLIMGEIRGAEAKDLLMALSTGHAGSGATLHAAEPRQALLRLEMLVQLGAPFWSLDAIRNLIFLSIQKLILVGRDRKEVGGHRRLLGIYRLTSHESSGILIDRSG